MSADLLHITRFGCSSEIAVFFSYFISNVTREDPDFVNSGEPKDFDVHLIKTNRGIVIYYYYYY